jgi:hypothetical protein
VQQAGDAADPVAPAGSAVAFERCQISGDGWIADRQLTGRIPHLAHLVGRIIAQAVAVRAAFGDVVNQTGLFQFGEMTAYRALPEVEDLGQFGNGQWFAFQQMQEAQPSLIG